jgi:hypothetical protein
MPGWWGTVIFLTIAVLTPACFALRSLVLWRRIRRTNFELDFTDDKLVEVVIDELERQINDYKQAKVGEIKGYLKKIHMTLETFSQILAKRDLAEGSLEQLRQLRVQDLQPNFLEMRTEMKLALKEAEAATGPFEAKLAELRGYYNLSREVEAISEGELTLRNAKEDLPFIKAAIKELARVCAQSSEALDGILTGVHSKRAAYQELGLDPDLDRLKSKDDPTKVLLGR